MSGSSTAGGGARPLGDLTYADVSESVLCWLPVNRSTLDALSHACRATRAQTARHRDFGRTTFMCNRGCHIRFSQELDAPTASCATILRHSDQLSSLHALSLNNTSLRAEEIAAVVSKCPSLRTLHLEKACADDKVAAAIACLAHLETLDVRYCKCITDLCLLAACRTLKSLNVGGTYVDDRGLIIRSSVDDRGVAAIVALPHLEELSLYECKFITNFTLLGGCRTLKSLNLTGTSVDDRGFAAIASLPHLEELCLDECKSISDFTPLRSCLLLQRLSADYSKIGNEGLAAIVSLPRLEELSFNCCESLTDFSPLCVCKSLKTLSLFYGCIYDQGLAVIVSLPCLEKLSLDCCKFISDFTPLRSCKLLKRLSLSRTYHDGGGLDDRGLAAVVLLPCLEDLNLDFCELISDFTPLRSCLPLKRLSANCTKIDDRGLAAVVSLPCLDELSLEDCSSITDFTPLGSCKSLKRLSAGDTEIDDRGLAAIASLPSLEWLSLDFCASVTDFTLLRSCKSLKVLSLCHTSIDDGGVAAVASFPILEELDVTDSKVTTDVSRHALKVTSSLGH